MTDLYPDQKRVYDQVNAFLRDPTPRTPWFVFNGAAGTGKTEVLAKLARERPQAIMCAFAGKSASVLRARTGLDVSTIHSAIMNFGGHVEDEDTGEMRPIFTDKEDLDFKGKVVFLDECGTVDERLGEKLVATGARIVACGDPHQLKPVRGTRFFDRADATLTVIRRQALDSPIIRQAHAVKDGRDYQPDGPNFRVVYRGQAIPGRTMITDPDVMREVLEFGGIELCWRNATRQRHNLLRRRAREIRGTTLVVGEPIMVLKNDYALRVFNGEIYFVEVARTPGEDLQVRDARGRSVILRNVTCEQIDPEFGKRRYEDGWLPVCLAYATTVHKYIGSEDNDVLVFDEYVGADRDSWVYTSLTRAVKRIMVVRD